MQKSSGSCSRAAWAGGHSLPHPTVTVALFMVLASASRLPDQPQLLKRFLLWAPHKQQPACLGGAAYKLTQALSPSPAKAWVWAPRGPSHSPSGSFICLSNQCYNCFWKLSHWWCKSTSEGRKTFLHHRHCHTNAFAHSHMPNGAFAATNPYCEQWNTQNVEERVRKPMHWVYKNESLFYLLAASLQSIMGSTCHQCALTQDN